MEEHQRISGSMLGSMGISVGSEVCLELHAALFNFDSDAFLFFFD